MGVKRTAAGRGAGGGPRATVHPQAEDSCLRDAAIDVHGLTQHVPDERIQERLAAMTSAQQACEALVQDARDDGGSDNVTVGRIVPRGTRV